MKILTALIKKEFFQIIYGKKNRYSFYLKDIENKKEENIREENENGFRQYKL